MSFILLQLDNFLDSLMQSNHENKAQVRNFLRNLNF